MKALSPVGSHHAIWQYREVYYLFSLLSLWVDQTVPKKKKNKSGLVVKKNRWKGFEVGHRGSQGGIVQKNPFRNCLRGHEEETLGKKKGTQPYSSGLWEYWAIRTPNDIFDP